MLFQVCHIVNRPLGLKTWPSLGLHSIAIAVKVVNCRILCFYHELKIVFTDIACTERKINQFNSTASCSHLVLIITLIFVWILSVKDVTWICFRRTFCNIFLDISGFWDGIWYIFVFDLIWLFQWIVFICYVVSSLPHCEETIGSQNLTFSRFT